MLISTDAGRAPRFRTQRRGARAFLLLRRFAIAAAALLLPLWFGGRGLFAGFTPDDMMNLFGYWSRPANDLIFANLFPFSAQYRPAGALFYLPLFHLFGLDPFPFRVLCFVLLLANSAVIYRVASHLAGRHAAAVTALLAAHHPAYVDFYYNTGTVYDLLCFFFYFSALSVYVAGRRRGPLSARRWVAFALLYAAALNSKEMAAALPVAVLVYEWAYQLKDRPSFAALAFLAATPIPYALAKLSAGSAFHNVGGYRMDVSWTRAAGNLADFYGNLLRLPLDTIAPGAAAVIAGALVVTVAAVRQAQIRWNAAFFLIAPLPVLFLPTRGLFAYYVALPGCWILAAYLYTRIVDAIRPPRISRSPAHLAAAAVLFGTLVAFHHARRWEPDSAAPVAMTISQLRALNLAPSNVLFLEDPFHDDEWTPLFIVRLLYRSRDLPVERLKMMPEIPSCNRIRGFDTILTMHDGSLRRISADEACALTR
ncbi:MAG: glycosyltransferase family 39 protein [Bryobacteraceae bacterium]